MSASQPAPAAGTADRDDGLPPHRYNAAMAAEIESRWQARWAADGTFDTPNPSGPLATGFGSQAGRRKFYILDMFPYPSGIGLHVGHPLGYIGTDVYARYLRMTGHHVLHTFGYDAFGLPAEQYAIDSGQHPAVTTRANIDAMRRQLRRLGLGHDTRRELATTDPGYYRWTQWIFLRVFNSWFDERSGRARPIADLAAEFETGQRETPEGPPWAALTGVQRRQVIDGYRLAYISEEAVNWCPGLGTVLANEEVTAAGRSDVGNYPVYRRPLRQWMLRITAFADRLLDDLELVDWPESVKQMQRHWIGASDGARITLTTTGDRPVPIEVFTTRPDTLAGATYLVLAPEHPAVDQIVPVGWPPGTPHAWLGQGTAALDTAGPAVAVAAFRRRASRLTERQRTARQAARTGIFTGAYVSNPITATPMPVFVAEHVLGGYGTGAIMAVPAHDDRDLEFARAFRLPVRTVLEPPPQWFAAHGTAPGTDPAGWPAAFAGAGRYLAGPGPALAGRSLPDAIAAAIDWLEARGAGHRSRSYRLRDWLFSRQRYWGEPFPIVYDDAGLPVALADDALPVLLPDMPDFRPEPQPDEGAEPVPPLARAASWTTAWLDLGDGVRPYRRELNTMPQWAGSCWYYLRYLDPGNDDAFTGAQAERYWMVPPDARHDGDGGVDLYVGGVEHAVLHLLYARFWHKLLYDLGHVSTREPFRRLFNQGYILADAFTDERGQHVPAADVTVAGDGTARYRGRPVTRRSGKMGKSLKNGVSPDEIYRCYGADTLRLYEMAMGPLDADRPWQTSDIAGAHRFLQRLWRLVVDERTGAVRVSDRAPGHDTLRQLNKTITIVGRDFAALRFNTAVARLIEFCGHAAAAARDGEVPRQLAEPLVLMVAPLAPHIAEELWRRLGHAASLAYEPFPVADPGLAADLVITMPVQINGKTRFTIDVPADAGKQVVEQRLAAHKEYARHTAGALGLRVIVVPGKIVSVVTG